MADAPHNLRLIIVINEMCGMVDSTEPKKGCIL